MLWSAVAVTSLLAIPWCVLVRCLRQEGCGRRGGSTIVDDGSSSDGAWHTESSQVPAHHIRPPWKMSRAS